MRALYTAATGMAAEQTRLDDIANNIANIATTGFKRSRSAFEDLLYQEIGHGDAPVSLGSGTRLAALERDFAQGAATPTGNPLDFALDGDGFFAVESPDGSLRYTRDGTFHRDSEGRVVTSHGWPLAGDIVIPEDATEIRVDADGAFSVVTAGQTEPSEIGKLQIATFVNPAGLRPIGNNMFTETTASGASTERSVQDGGASVMQGYREGSNVDVATELVSMIVAQRAYELNSKVVQAADEALGVAANLKR